MSRLVREPIDLDALSRDVASPEAGAILTFSGVVRNRNAGRTVVSIDYHAYDEMAVREMDKIEAEVAERWPGVRARIVHRVGPLNVGETSVAIAVSSAHRAEGYAASRHAIDRIKETVPIWKKEMYPDGHEWIEGS